MTSGWEHKEQIGPQTSVAEYARLVRANRISLFFHVPERLQEDVMSCMELRPGEPVPEKWCVAPVAARKHRARQRLEADAQRMLGDDEALVRFLADPRVPTRYALDVVDHLVALEDEMQIEEDAA